MRPVAEYGIPILIKFALFCVGFGSGYTAGSKAALRDYHAGKIKCVTVEQVHTYCYKPKQP